MKTKLPLLLLLACWMYNPLTAQHSSELSFTSSVVFHKIEPIRFSNINGKAKAIQFKMQFAQPIFRRMYLETGLLFSSRPTNVENQYYFCYCGPELPVFPLVYSQYPENDSKRIGFSVGLRHDLKRIKKWLFSTSLGFYTTYDWQKQKYYLERNDEIFNPYQLDSFGKLVVRYQLTNQLFVEVSSRSNYTFGQPDIYYKRWSLSSGIGIGVQI